jgi:hypothetical protein
VNIDFLYAWSPKQLSGSGKQLPLSRVETAFEILFVGLFLTWWNSLFGAESVFVQTELVNQLTMSESMHALLWPVNVLGMLSIAISLYGFIKAGWNRNSLILNILLGLAYLVVIIIMLQFDQYATLESLQEPGIIVTKIVEHMVLNVRITLGIIAAFVIWDIYASFRKLKM